MPRKQSDEVLLTFCDVAACFSADEWKLLHEWQKELYNNVMKEIHQALTSLGPLIANSVFSLRPKEKENLGNMDFQDLEITASINPVSSNMTAESNMWFEGNQYGTDSEVGHGRHRNADISSVASLGQHPVDQRDSEGKENIVGATDEWKLLHEWQKELYNNVMKEIHRALTSLGPLIATSVFSLRPKKKENLGCVNFQELEIKASINPLSTGNTTAEREVWLEGDQLLMDTQDTDGGGRSDVPRKESAEIPPVASPCIKREEGIYHSEQMVSERKENTVSATGFPPFNNTEVDAVLKDYKYTDRGGSSISLNLEPEVTTPASSIGINEEGETYAINLQDYPRSHTGYGGTARPGNIGKCAKYKSKPRPSKTTANKGQETLIQSSQMWSESDWEISGEKTEQWQSGCHQLANSKLHQVTANVQNVQTSDAYNRSANAVRNYNIVSSKSSPQQGSRSYASFESEQSCPPNSPSRHLGACEVKSRFACSDCGKCFPGMSNLITHQRIHTGERPFHCDVCAKSFNQKGALQRHQILHTGEKPYQCNICGKKFNVKHNLVGHQRIHTRVQKSLTNGRSETV